MSQVKGTLTEQWRAQSWRGCPEQVRNRGRGAFPERKGVYLVVVDMLVLQQHQTIRADGDKAGNSEQQLSQSHAGLLALGSAAQGRCDAQGHLLRLEPGVLEQQQQCPSYKLVLFPRDRAPGQPPCAGR